MASLLHGNRASSLIYPWFLSAHRTAILCVYMRRARGDTCVCPSSCHVHFLSSDLTVLCAPVCLRRCGSVAHGVCFCVCLLSVHLKHVEVKWFWQPFLTDARLIISAELSLSQNPKSLKENCCFSDYLLYKHNRFHPICFFENQFLLITETKRFWRVRGCSEVLGDCIERPEAAAEDTRQLASFFWRCLSLFNSCFWFSVINFENWLTVLVIFYFLPPNLWDFADFCASDSCRRHVFGLSVHLRKTVREFLKI